MASALMLSALRGAIEKCIPMSGSSRSIEVNERTKEMLDKVISEENADVFESFSVTVTRFLQQQVKDTCDNKYAAAIKRTRLWVLFDQLRNDTEGVLISKWNELLFRLKIDVFDPICMQAVYKQLFEGRIKDEFSKNCKSCEEKEPILCLSGDELNALRYAAGFVPHSLLKQFEERKGEKFSRFITCLGDMGVVGEGSDIMSYTTKWFDLVNRGGLFPLNDNSFSLFVAIEKVVKTVLESHMLSRTANKESFKQNVHDVIAANV